MTAVATFYSMYRRTPTGEYLVGVCTNTLCAIMGGDAILEALQDHLGVHAGETTADGRVTLEHIECNAACDYAPVVMVNWEFFDNQTPSSARELVDELRAGATVTPTRGAPLCTFRETARILAGLPDDRAGADDGTAGDATLAGLRVAHELGMHAPPRMPSGRTHRIRREPTARTVDAPNRRDEPRRADRDRARRRPSADVPAQGTRDGMALTPLTPVLSRYWDDPESWTLDTYRRHDGYRALTNALRR